MPSALSPINRGLNLIPRRAENREAEHLRNTFVDSGVAVAMETVDDQAVFGRRGTGKTHALRYLESVAEARNDLAIYVDLRQIGSPDGLFIGESASRTQRASRLLVDLLGYVHEEVLRAVVEDDTLIDDDNLVARLDRLAGSISSVRLVGGEVERSEEGEHEQTSRHESGLDVKLSADPTIGVRQTSSAGDRDRVAVRETRRGTEQVALNFAEVARALRDLSEALTTKRIWLLLDEWSSVPTDLQPLLAEFVVRCILPLRQFTLKIAAIEQQSTFRAEINGQQVGIELGADVTANVDLDEFMVFEQNEEQARHFFRGLFFKHLTLGGDGGDLIEGLTSEAQLVRLGFTDKRAFDELVRAAEGVPRDAINIAAKAALRAGRNTISVDDVRFAARAWFESDKGAALESRVEASRLLNWIIDNVIRGKRARGFMVNQRDAADPLLQALFDARVIHVVRRGYSAQDEPGERYNVYVIDFGAYVDLIQTKSAPQGVLPLDADDGTESFTEVPTQDLRALRRAILNLNDFHALSPVAG
jgi:PAS domain-containing protein